MLKKKIKQEYYIYASAMMILPPAFLFYVLSNTLHLFIVTIIIYSIALIKTKPINYSDRSIIYTTLTALILAVFLNMLFPMHQERFILIGKAFTPQITIPFALFLAALSTFFKGNTYIIGVNAALAMFVLLMAGDFQGLTSYNDSYSSLSFLVEVQLYNKTFIIVGIMELLAMLYAFSLSEQSHFHHLNNAIKKYKYVLVTLSLCFTIFLSFFIFYLFKYFEHDLRNIESFIMHYKPIQKMSSSSAIFGKEPDLNQTINENMRKNKRAIMVRVESDRPPGYLRGRSYDYYNHGIWKKIDDKKNRLKETANINQLAVSAFYIYNTIISKNSSHKFNIYMTDNCISNYIFYPAYAKRIEMVAEHLNYTLNGDLIPYSWSKSAGYTAYTYENPPFPAYQFPTPSKYYNFLYLPTYLKNDLKKIVSEIPTLKRAKGDREVINELVNYFKKNFSYTLKQKTIPNKMDPILFFLKQTHKGHCELFATSTTMLLRTLGIPTRYVTGFICDELHPSGKYYVARMGNAHAWCEAYLRDEKRWILVDATPPEGVNPYKEEWGYFEEWLDRIKYSFNKVIANIQRGYITKAIINFFIDIFFTTFNFIYDPIRGTVILLILGALFLFWKNYKRKKYLILNLPQDIIKLQKEFQAFTKCIKSTPYSKNITLSDWIEKIKNDEQLNEQTIKSIENIVENYRILRFSKKQIDDNTLAEFKKSVNKFKKIKFN